MTGAADAARPPLIRLEGVDLGYGRKAVLSGVDLEVRRGAFLGVVGPNGSGKTTLLRAILGVLSPRRGRVLCEEGLRIGYVPQRARLDPLFPLRVRELVMMGRYPHVGFLGRPQARDRDAVARACATVGLEGRMDAPWRDLSGGQQQRALIARALAVEPELLILDEPTNGMDLASERAIVDVIAGLHAREGCTVLFVTHLLNLLANAASEFALIHDGSVEVGPRERMLDAARLSGIYGVPVDVYEVGGRMIVAARGGQS